MIILLRFVSATLVLTTGMAVAFATGLLELEDALAIYVLALCAVALVALGRAAHAATGGARWSQFDRALSRSRAPVQRPGDLGRLETDLELASQHELQFGSRIVPLLRDLAESLLAARHGVDLERGRALLGEEAWSVLAGESNDVDAALTALERL